MKTKRNNRKPPPPPRRGLVLVVVLVVVALLSLVAYTFAGLMSTHYGAAKQGGRQLQTRMLVESGIEAVRLYLMQTEAGRTDVGGHFNNVDYFQAIPVLIHQDVAQCANFTVLAPNLDDEGNLSGVRYGLEDESARLNINALVVADQIQENAGRDLLMRLPGMTEDVADAILDWIDEDDEARDYGAESSYYQGLRPPYTPKNGPLDTVEELLLVRGVTPVREQADAQARGHGQVLLGDAHRVVHRQLEDAGTDPQRAGARRWRTGAAGLRYRQAAG